MRVKDGIRAVWAVGGALALAGTAAAQGVSTGGTIVVTATRLATPGERVASAVTVIDQGRLQDRQPREVGDALRSVPGVDIVQSGGPGGTVSAFLRGAKSEHTLVLIDGIEINNPSGAGRDSNLALISLDNVERIEVLRGPQGTLYGSDAIGGVINVITHRGYGPPGVTMSLEGGSYNTFRESLEVRGGTPVVNYSAGLDRQDSEGISRAAERNGNPEKDGFDNSSFSGRFGWTPTPAFGLEVVGRTSLSHYDYDDFDFVSGLPADSDSEAEESKTFVRTQGRLALFDERWEQTLGLSYSLQNREDTSSIADSAFDGTLWKADWQNNVSLGEAHIATLGAEYEEESAETVYESAMFAERFDRQTASTWAGFAQDAVHYGPFSATLGGRYDEHSVAGGEFTWRAAPLVEIAATGTRLKGSYGTGFKSPSLFQLHSVYGSPDLKPETSRGWDAGLEQTFGDSGVTAGATWFQTEFDDLIDFDAALSRYQNIDAAETHGVETFVGVRPLPMLEVNGTYTWMETENKTTGAELLRRPRHKAGVDVTVRPSARCSATLGAVYVGERMDTDFATYTDVTLGDYVLVNASARVEVMQHVELFARVENLLDEDYEEVLGYGTPGLSGYGGVKARF